MKILLALNIIIVLLFACSPNISGGVEEGNVVSGISGIVISPDGDTLSNTVVDLRYYLSESNNLGDSSFCDTTDENGTYHFTNIPPLLYKLSVLHSSEGAIILDSVLYKYNDTLEIDLLLKRTGAYKYTLSTPAKESTNFYIPGTSYKRLLDSGENEITFTGLPEGSKPLIINKNNGHHILSDSAIIANDTIDISIMSVLMISDYETSGNANFLYQRSIINRLGVNTIVLSSSNLSDSILSGVAAIYVSYLTDTSTSFTTLLNQTNVPLIVANYQFFPLLGLTDTSSDTGVTFGTEATTDALIYYSSNSPLLRYYDSTQTNTVGINLGAPGEPIWGIPKTGESQRLIVSSRDNKRCHLFTYEKDSQTFIGSPNKRIVGIFTGDIQNSSNTDKLIEASILWAAGYL